MPASRFFDTADVYGDGRSEQLIGRFLADHPDLDVWWRPRWAAGPNRSPESYTLANFQAWTDRSPANLGVDALDLVQLHCPPTPVFDSDQVFDALDSWWATGAIAAYGGQRGDLRPGAAGDRPAGVASVQIILNAFRQKPLEQVLPAAAEAGVAIIARVPLASGLLSGRYTHDTTFPADDHRNYNRPGRRSTSARRSPG